MRPTTEGHWITQGWNSSTHRGTDWGMPNGSGLQAVLDGTVVDYTRTNGAEVNRPLRGHMTNSQHWPRGKGTIDDIGNCLVLRHANNTYTVYLHVSPYSVANLRGKTFKKGQRLPVTSGHNGWSTGPHLHFEVFVNGVRRNPVPFLDAISKPTTGGTTTVSQNITLTTARQLAYAILGRNGHRSSSALSGGHDADLNKHHVGSPLTNTYIATMHGSTEAQGYRTWLSDRMRERTAYLNERDTARTQLANVTAERDALKKLNSGLAESVSKLNKDLDHLDSEINVISKQKTELEKQLQTCQATGGELNKWETFKTLIRELLGR